MNKEKTYTIELTEKELAEVLSNRDQWTIDKAKAFVDDYEEIIRLQRYALR